jgi:hypothetical protein
MYYLGCWKCYFCILPNLLCLQHCVTPEYCQAEIATIMVTISEYTSRFSAPHRGYTTKTYGAAIAASFHRRCILRRQHCSSFYLELYLPPAPNAAISDLPYHFYCRCSSLYLHICIDLASHIF